MTGDASGNRYIEIENLSGTSFDDVLTGNHDANVLQGLDGDDTLIGNDGDDLLSGGDGNDVAVFAYAQSNYSIVWQYNETLRVTHLGGKGSDLLSSIERLRFDDKDLLIDPLEGTADADWLDWTETATGASGGSGTDMVSFSQMAQAVSVVQQTGVENVIVSYGSSVYRLTGSENLTGTSQNDEFFFAQGLVRSLGGQDVFYASGAGIGIYDGSAGRDTLDYSRSDAGVEASLFRDRGWSGDAAGDRYSGIEDLIGTNHADQLWGDNANNRIEGLHGDYTITGAGGDDYILAGFGTDVILYSGNRADYRIESAGIRTEVEHLNDGADGFDILGHAEILRFADGDFIL